MNIQVCGDTSDAVALYLPQRLYLKPFAKLNISVQLPPHKVHGKSLSNWELMEKIRKMVQPESFSMLKVSKHSSEVIRFDAELDNKNKLERVVARLNDRVVKLTNYPDELKLKVIEAKIDFPSRHSWDSFFRDATDMDEMKPGERPDTVHIANLPIRWFVHDRDKDEDAPPSESIFKRAFEKFGSIRQVDVPVADPFRMQMKAAIRGISSPPEDAALYFEGYVQFSEYVGFVRCMDALRGNKLLRKKDDIAEWCSIRVDFDKTKHMTDAAIKRRAIVRERLMERKRAKEEDERNEKEKISRSEAKERQKYERVELEKLQKMKEREERRKKKQLEKLMQKDDIDLNSKVAEEQKKLLKAQKKLQAIRLIEELFKRIELRPELQCNGSRPGRYYALGERTARQRVVDRYKRQQEATLEDQRNQLKCALDGRIVIRSALETKKHRRDSSISSLSSDEEHGHKRIKHEKIKQERLAPETEMQYKNAAGLYGMGNPYGFGYPFAAVPPHAFYAPQTSMYYPVRGGYYPPPESYVRRGRGAPRGRGRGRPRMPYFEGPDATQQYYKYFKKLTEFESRNDHDDRARTRSRSRSRSRRRSYSRSRSRSRRRSYSRSRSRTRRSRTRRSSTRSRRSRSRNRRSRSHHSRSRSRRRSRSRSYSRHSRSRTRHTPSPAKEATKQPTPTEPTPRERSKSWSLPKEGEARKSWSKSPQKE